MWFPKFTKPPSETSLLVGTIQKLAAELQAQSESHRKLSDKLLELLTERDAQIRMVIESRFQTYVTTPPTAQTEPSNPETFDHLQDVTEPSADSAGDQMEANTKSLNKASQELEEALAQDFEDLAQEHAAAHGQERPA